MGKDFIATICKESGRASSWQEVFGSLEVPLRSPLPHEASAPGIARAWFYDIDLQLLTTEQRTRLIAFIARKFDLTEHAVDQDLDKVGCPILAEDVVITVSNPLRWL